MYNIEWHREFRFQENKPSRRYPTCDGKKITDQWAWIAFAKRANILEKALENRAKDCEDTCPAFLIPTDCGELEDGNCNGQSKKKARQCWIALWIDEAEFMIQDEEDKQ